MLVRAKLEQAWSSFDRTLDARAGQDTNFIDTGHKRGYCASVASPLNMLAPLLKFLSH